MHYQQNPPPMLPIWQLQQHQNGNNLQQIVSSYCQQLQHNVYRARRDGHSQAIMPYQLRPQVGFNTLN